MTDHGTQLLELYNSGVKTSTYYINQAVMWGKWLFSSIFGAVAERRREHHEAKLERKSERRERRLERKIGHLDLKAAKMDYLVAKCQYKATRHQARRCGKWERKAERCNKKAAKLASLRKQRDGTDQGQEESKPEDANKQGTWVKDDQDDITILPPGYDEVMRDSPPSYDEVTATKTEPLYPVLS